MTDEQKAMCDAYGFYTVTNGYRKVPGNKCYGGIDLNPTVYQCTTPGLLSFRTLITLLVISAVLYYLWPYIEGVIILLPLPDPKAVKEKAWIWMNLVREKISKKERQPKGKLDTYTKNFNQAPESLGESDDEEDVGKTKKLSYGDSDEEDKDSELINLD